ncbi:hypothetical protein KF840_16970 [bacterium]|nr:hypothetical protein [bacterium]
MANQPQHCPTCQTEYVAGIAACADCGGPLAPGPLDRYAAPRGADAPAASASAPAGGFDAVLARLPGLRADHAVRALLLEEIPCFVECEGLTKTYHPGTPPAEPFAVTLPVTVHVRGADLDTAREVLDSLASEDLIGDQWSDEEIAEAAAAASPIAGGPFEEPASAIADDPTAGAPQPQSTSMVAVALVVVVVIGLLLLFGRQ